jgi:hypothetical protein
VTINMLLGGACGKARGWGGARCPPGWTFLCSNEEAVAATLTATAAATAVVYSGSTRVQWSEINDCGGAPSSSGRGRRHVISSSVFFRRRRRAAVRLSIPTAMTAVLSQSLIDLRAVMSLALPARRCYQSSRD